ncbi:MAG: hypothetical protein HON90_02345 [Halobacteriovoraceae bacterium]|jgi:Spy/CpxP family protein refolding chaperone|nr:hypothetical protein [Halobacteriovoraceae bacterium]
MKLLVILLASLLSLSAFSAIKMKDLRALTKSNKQRIFCADLSLAKIQKNEIKKILKTARIQIKSHLKMAVTAQKNFNKVILNATTTKEEAMDAAKELRKTMEPIKTIRKATKLEVQFDVLTGEQRLKFLECLRNRKKIVQKK